MMKKYISIVIALFIACFTVSAQIKIGNYTFKDGSEYVGELKGKKPNGKGKTTFKNDTTFSYSSFTPPSIAVILSHNRSFVKKKRSNTAPLFDYLVFFAIFFS